MKNVILFGSTGHLGKKIAAELRRHDYNVTAVVRSEAGRKEVAGLVQHCLTVNFTNPNALSTIFSKCQIVVSALGKSVSPRERSKPSFRQVDLDINSSILAQAKKGGAEKFVYISSLHAERYRHLQYCRVHHEFSEKLKSSGIDYAILKPPALFSAFLDMIPMAEKGFLFTLGRGDKLTNPISEGDMAKICVQAIHQPNVTIEAGGKEIMSRHQINETIQQVVNPQKTVRKIPIALVKTGLPLLRIFDRNLYDKMAFFTEVMQHDTVAPLIGKTRLSEYLENQMKNIKQ
jgi:uncharacterized protein YbjT (DUF2867 family)